MLVHKKQMLCYHILIPDFRIQSMLVDSYANMNVSEVKVQKCSLQRFRVLWQLM